MLDKKVIDELKYNIKLSKTVKFFLKKFSNVEMTDSTFKQYYDDVNNLLAMSSVEQLDEYKNKHKNKIYHESIIIA